MPAKSKDCVLFPADGLSDARDLHREGINCRISYDFVMNLELKKSFLRPLHCAASSRWSLGTLGGLTEVTG